MTQCMIVADPCEERNRLQDLLSVYGFDMTDAANANEALEKCSDDMPDVVLLPEKIDGVEASSFIKRLRRKGGKTPAVFLCTSEPDSERIGQAIWEGANDYLIAPFDADVLDGKLRQAGVV